MPNSDPRRLVVSVVHSLLLALAWSHSPQAGPAPHIAGYNSVGNTFYPHDGLANAGKIDLEYDVEIRCAVTNSAGTLGWFGLGTEPGRIVKVDLTNLQKIETLVLTEGENSFFSAVIDGQERYGYFGTLTQPGRIVKVDLESMTRVGAITLPEGEGYLHTAITNASRTLAYFGTNTAPARLVRIDLETFERTGSLLLPANESNLISGAADLVGQFGYFGCEVVPARIVKVDLENLSRVGSISLTGLTEPRMGIVEPAGAYVYFCLANPARMVRIDLASFSTFDQLTFPAGINLPQSFLLSGDGTRALVALFDGLVALVDMINFSYQGVLPSLGFGTEAAAPIAIRPRDLSDTGIFAFGNAPATVVRATISNGDRSAPLYLEDESFHSTAVVDHDWRYAYYATDTAPPRLVKIDLENRKRVGSIILYNSAPGVLCSAIDGIDQYAYFGTRLLSSDDISFLFRVNLDSFNRDTLLVDPSHDSLISLAFDESGNRGWIGTRTSSAPTRMLVQSFDANQFDIGADSFSLLSSQMGNLEAAAYDPVTDYPVFASTASPALLARFNPTLSGVAVKPLPNGYNYCHTLIRHPSNGLLYAGLGDTTGQILSFLPDSLDFVDQDPFASDTGGIYSGAFLPSGEHGLFTTNGALLKVPSDLSGLIGNLALPIGDSPARGLLLSPEGDRAWYGSGGDDAVVGQVNLFPRDQIKAIRIALGQTAEVSNVNFYSFASVGPRRSLVERFPRGLDVPLSVAFDPSNGHALFGTSTYPGQIIKFDTENMTVVANTTLKSGSDDLQCGFMEPDGEHACFGTFTSPGKVIRVRTSDLQPVGTLELDPGEDNLRAAAVDPMGEFGYFASPNSPSRVAKVELNTLTRQAGLILEEGDEQPKCLLIDPTGDFAYLGCGTIPSRIVRIRLSDFTRVDALPFEPGENFLTSGAIDPAGEFAYFSLDTIPAQIVKVRLSDFTRVGILPLEGDDFSFGMSIDSEGRRLVVGAGTGSVSVIDLETFTREGTAQLRELESALTQAVVVDASGENAYLGIGTSPGRVVRVELAPKPLRLGIFGNAGEDKELLWQSPPIPLSASETWVNVPISQGNPPSLILPPDEYWLAWQVDASTDAAGYIPGASGEGFSLYWPAGPFPTSVTTETSTGVNSTTETWSVYITYDEAPEPTATQTATRTPTPIQTPTATAPPEETETPTATRTPNIIFFTATPTPSSTPETSPTSIPVDYDIAPEPPDGVIDARDLLEWFGDIQDGSPTRELLFDFSRFWQFGTK